MNRAKQHLEELKDQIRVYGESHPYRIRWERRGNPKLGEWRCVLRITEQPDREMAVVAGDVIHNIRSALNHLAVAIAPEKNQRDACFPIRDVDPWNGGNKDARETFKRAVAGMPDDAVAVIKQLQPYSQWAPDPTALLFYMEGEMVDGQFRRGAGLGKLHVHRPENHFLSILHRFDLADKHSALMPLVTSLPGGTVTIRDKAGMILHTRDVIGPREDGAPVLEIDSPDPRDTPETEMDMEIRGPVRVTVRIGWPQGDADLVEALTGFTRRLPRVVFSALEPFVRV